MYVNLSWWWMDIIIWMCDSINILQLSLGIGLFTYGFFFFLFILPVFFLGKKSSEFMFAYEWSYLKVTPFYTNFIFDIIVYVCLWMIIEILALTTINKSPTPIQTRLRSHSILWNMVTVDEILRVQRPKEVGSVLAIGTAVPSNCI